jgi:hypothetical protein
MRSHPVAQDVAEKIYDILCEHAGCYRAKEGETDLSRMSFIRYATEGTWTEFRFGGSLGFGGKVWNNAGHWYVSCYYEDEGKKQTKIIGKTNAALDKLFEETYGVPPNKL